MNSTRETMGETASETTGEIVGAGLLSHAPTIMLSEAQRLALNDGREISLVPGLRRLRSDVFARLNADAVIVFDTHWFTTVEFIVSGHARRRGAYTSDELPRGMAQVEYDLRGDPQLAEAMASCARDAGVKCIACDEPQLPVHYPTVNLAHYLNNGEAWLSVGVCQTAGDHNFLNMGEAIGRAVAASGRRVILIASGGLSHRFWPLDQLESHEASDPKHIITVAARQADEQRIEWLCNGDHARVIDAMDDYRAHKPEGKFGHYLMLIGALGGRQCGAAGRPFSDYENATGTGQIHLWFDRPATGWR